MHRRAASQEYASASALRTRSLSPGSMHLPTIPVPLPVPTTALIESAAGGAHHWGRGAHSGFHRKRNSESHVEVNGDHNRVLGDLKQLYNARPSMDIIQRLFDIDAVFEDPITKCKGLAEIAAQWYALPKFVSESENISIRVMSSTPGPNRLVYEQKQAYTNRFTGNKKVSQPRLLTLPQVVTSIIVVDMDEEDRIIRMVEQWDGQELPTRYGAALLRRAVAKLGPWLVRVPKG
ncbi:hypothetical protein FISHEDRAFT_37718 [Fistulina hepatica ATCC 64428]|nr:hypothetical protein FISHEDRAFT_37718 [Fistulina hepatica ATCC 64428]